MGFFVEAEQGIKHPCIHLLLYFAVYLLCCSLSLTLYFVEHAAMSLFLASLLSEQFF